MARLNISRQFSNNFHSCSGKRNIVTIIGMECCPGGAIIAALHDLNLAAQYCDWLIMLNGGQIHAEGIPKDVLTVENIKRAYGAEVCVYPHPINKLPTTLITAGGNHVEEREE